MTPDSIHHNPFSNTYASPQVTILLTILLILFLLLGFFTVYFSRCFLQSIAHTWNLRHIRSGLAVVHPPSSSSSRGLNTATVLSFPTITFSSAREKCSMECAICLAEFNDEDFLRILTVCRHAFHRDCVDLWFTSHKTCPVCRRSLDRISPEKTPSPPPAAHLSVRGSETPVLEVVRIDIDDTPKEMAPSTSAGVVHARRRSGGWPERFPRSNSTGHSMEIYGWVKVCSDGGMPGGSDPVELSARPVTRGRDSHGGAIRPVTGDIDSV